MRNLHGISDMSLIPQGIVHTMQAMVWIPITLYVMFSVWKICGFMCGIHVFSVPKSSVGTGPKGFPFLPHDGIGFVQDRINIATLFQKLHPTTTGVVSGIAA